MYEKKRVRLQHLDGAKRLPGIGLPAHHCQIGLIGKQVLQPFTKQ